MVGLKHEVQEQQRKIEALRAEQFQLLKKAQKAEAEAAEARAPKPHAQPEPRPKPKPRRSP